MGRKSCDRCNGAGFLGPFDNKQRCATCGGSGAITTPDHAPPGTRFADGTSASGTRTSGGTTCFPGSAQVLTPQGSRAIAELREGDLVISQNPEGLFEAQPVLKCYRHASAPLWRITTMGGVVVRATGNHRILTRNGWKRVRRLAPGQTVWAVVDGRAVADAVRDVVQTCEAEPVFNIVVRANFNFVADAVLAGSFATLMGVQAALWRVREVLKSETRLRPIVFSAGRQSC